MVSSQKLKMEEKRVLVFSSCKLCLLEVIHVFKYSDCLKRKRKTLESKFTFPINSEKIIWLKIYLLYICFWTKLSNPEKLYVKHCTDIILYLGSDIILQEMRSLLQSRWLRILWDSHRRGETSDHDAVHGDIWCPGPERVRPRAVLQGVAVPVSDWLRPVTWLLADAAGRRVDERGEWGQRRVLQT